MNQLQIRSKKLYQFLDQSPISIHLLFLHHFHQSILRQQLFTRNFRLISSG
jgi:hypothetical protein